MGRSEFTATREDGEDRTNERCEKFRERPRLAGGNSQDMRKHVRPFAADVGRHLHVHGAGKPSIEPQATGSERRGEMVTGGATVWGSGEIQSEKKDGSGRESHGPSGDDGRIFVMYHGTSSEVWSLM